MELSGWILALEKTASKGSPELRNSECQSYFICVYTHTHWLCFHAGLPRKFMGFFQMQCKCSALHWAAKILCLKLCPELCLPLNPHLPAQSFGPEEWSLHARAVQGVPQAGCWSSKAVPPRGNGSAADCTPGVTSCWLWCGPQLHPAWLFQGTGTSRDNSRADADRAAQSSCSFCPVEPGSSWGLRGQRDLLANM